MIQCQLRLLVLLIFAVMGIFIISEWFILVSIVIAIVSAMLGYDKNNNWE